MGPKGRGGALRQRVREKEKLFFSPFFIFFKKHRAHSFPFFRCKMRKNEQRS